MPIEGSLREFGVHDIFQLLHLSRKTGELVIVREPARERGAVVFDSGAVVRAEVDSTGAHLGNLLLNAGKITAADLERAEGVHGRQPERDWRDIFRAMDVVSPEEMEKYVKFEVQELALQILDWQDGRFSFAERAVEEAERRTWIPTESLLMEGARRADELSALPTAVESSDAVPQLSEQAAREGGMLDLHPEEWELLGQIDGERDVKAIAWALGRSEFEVSKVISKLVEHGLLEVGPPEHARTRPPHELALERAAQLIEDDDLAGARKKVDGVLRDHPEEPGAHQLLARIAEKGGDLQRALAGYEHVRDLDPLAEDARLRLGLVRLKLGDVAGATHEWTAYLRMAQDSEQRRLVERAMAAARELEVVMGQFDGNELA